MNNKQIEAGGKGANLLNLTKEKDYLITNFDS